MAKSRKAGTTTGERGADGDLAFRLLELRQRLDAWDRLYNEEMGKLSEQLARVTSDYLHAIQQQQEAVKPRRPRKKTDGNSQ